MHHSQKLLLTAIVLFFLGASSILFNSQSFFEYQSWKVVLDEPSSSSFSSSEGCPKLNCRLRGPSFDFWNVDCSNPFLKELVKTVPHYCPSPIPSPIPSPSYLSSSSPSSATASFPPSVSSSKSSSSKLTPSNNFKTPYYDSICSRFEEAIPGIHFYEQLELDLAHWRKKGGISREQMDHIIPEHNVCTHLQIIEGQLFIDHDPGNFQERAKYQRLLIQLLVQAFDDLPDTEMVLCLGDTTRSPEHPVFTFARPMDQVPSTITPTNLLPPQTSSSSSSSSIPVERKESSFLWPDFNFFGWVDAGTWAYHYHFIYKEGIGNASSSSSSLPSPGFLSKDPRLYFRGARLPGTEVRTAAFDATVSHPTLILGEEHVWRPGTIPIPMKNYCHFRHLLHAQGWSGAYSSRLKYLLLCGSAVVFSEPSQEEFWYRMLRSDENIIFLPSPHSQSQLSPQEFRIRKLVEITEFLQNNPKIAESIGKKGQELAGTYLNHQAVLCYMRRLLFGYTELLNYEVKKMGNAVPVFDALLQGNEPWHHSIESEDIKWN